MKRTVLLSCAASAIVWAAAWALCVRNSEAAPSSNNRLPTQQSNVWPAPARFEAQIFVNGRPLEEYYAHGRIYVEALRGAEYEVRLRNPLAVRIAVALSVDGLNSIDARRTTAWNASKWVIGPNETITVGGWQMSSERARRFYFTTEEDSYASKMGQPTNLGLISAVFFRERSAKPITILPPPRRSEENRPMSKGTEKSEPSIANSEQDRAAGVSPRRDDEYAATGIGRSVQNDVRWIQMELDSRPVGEVTIRYEYYSALVRLGILPSPRSTEALPRRERATGFEDRRFCPEP
jgi:hypothetical protein